MRVYWWQAGLHIEPENERDRERLGAIEATLRALDGLSVSDRPKGETFSSAPEAATKTQGQMTPLPIRPVAESSEY